MNPFQILGINNDASLAEIKQVYKKLAKEHHPDKGGNAEKFKQVSEAYSMINDEASLKRYRSRGIYNFDDDFNTFFKDVFGGGGFRTQQRQHQALTRVTLNISLEESFQGLSKKFFYKQVETCTACGGMGALTSEFCLACNGKGFKVGPSHPHMVVKLNCNICQGSGRKPTNICLQCSGSGKKQSTLQSEVIIPKSVKNGTVVWSVDRKAQVVFMVIPHNNFHRQNFEIFSQIEIPLSKVFNGSSIEIDTLHGPVDLIIPRCVQNDQLLRLKKKGMLDSRRNNYSDHIVKVKIQIPKLSEENCTKLSSFINKLGEQ